VCKQNCSSFASVGLSVGFPMNRDRLWGFANVCNVGGVSFFFFCGGKKKQNKFGSAELHFDPVPSNLHCPVKKLKKISLLQ